MSILYYLSICTYIIFWKIEKGKCKHQLHVLTVGGHEETSVDFFGVTEVRLHLVAAGIEPPLMDAAGFDIQHIKTVLWTTGGGQSLCVCLRFEQPIAIYLLIFVIDDCMS